MDFKQSGKIRAPCAPALLSCEGEMGRLLAPPATLGRSLRHWSGARGRWCSCWAARPGQHMNPVCSAFHGPGSCGHTQKQILGNLRTQVLDNFTCLGPMAHELVGALRMSVLLLHNIWSLQVGWEGTVLGWDTAPCMMHKAEKASNT